MSEVHVKGLAELQKFLDTLPAKIERNILRSALRQGANVIMQGARTELAGRSKTGDLARNLRVSARARGGTVTASVKNNLFYAVMVEYGTRAHFISVNVGARPSRMTRRGMREFSIGTINKMVYRGSLVIGGNFVGESVSHPGARPLPFMRSALDKNAKAAVVAVGEQIKKRLTREGIDASDVIVEGDE